MSYYDFTLKTGDVRCPEMDISEAARRILAILNDNSAPAPSTAGGSTGGNTTSVGTTFNSAEDVSIDNPNIRKQFPPLNTPRGVLLVAKHTNTNPVTIGGSSVTSTAGTQRGITLTAAGMPSAVLPVANLNQLYINGLTAGDGVGVVIL